MDIKDVKMCKREMETSITKAVQHFEKVTGLEVDGFHQDTVRPISGSTFTAQVTACVKLP